MDRRLIAVTAAALVAGGVVAARSRPPAAYAAAPQTVDVTGTIQPIQHQTLSFGVQGTVTEVDVHPGQHVPAGTVLARLNAAALTSQLKQAEASVARARASLASDRAKAKSSQLSVQQAQDTLAQDQSSLAAAQAAEVLAAPVAGVVESVSARVGESLSPGATVLTIVPPGATVQILTQVAQQSSTSVQVGNTASANIPAADLTVSGSVTAVGTGTPGTGATANGTIEVTITLSNPPADLRDGMTALVNIYPNGSPLVQATGSLKYANEWDVTAAQGGALTDLKVKPGDTVSSGQTVATMGGATLDDAVQKAQQSVRQAQDSLAQAQANASSTAQQVADQAALASAQAAEAAAQANLAEATITAPFAGTVGQVSLSMGQAASGTITLIGDAGFEADVAVLDSEIGQVRIGQQAVVTPAGATQPLQATVTQITPQATVGSGEPSYPVTLTILGNPSGLLAGASAEVAIQVGRR